MVGLILWFAQHVRVHVYIKVYYTYIVIYVDLRN